MEQSSKTKSFQDLLVWKKSHNVVIEIYKKTKKFPKEELYGITSQMRRSAVSVPANIAEGYRKKSKAEKIHFFEISLCSLQELRYYIILCKDLNYFDSIDFENLNSEINEIGKMITAYINAIEAERNNKKT